MLTPKALVGEIRSLFEKNRKPSTEAKVATETKENEMDIEKTQQNADKGTPETATNSTTHTALDLSFDYEDVSVHHEVFSVLSYAVECGSVSKSEKVRVAKMIWKCSSASLIQQDWYCCIYCHLTQHIYQIPNFAAGIDRKYVEDIPRASVWTTQRDTHTQTKGDPGESIRKRSDGRRTARGTCVDTLFACFLVIAMFMTVSISRLILIYVSYRSKWRRQPVPPRISRRLIKPTIKKRRNKRMQLGRTLRYTKKNPNRRPWTSKALIHQPTNPLLPQQKMAKPWLMATARAKLSPTDPLTCFYSYGKFSA